MLIIWGKKTNTIIFIAHSGVVFKVLQVSVKKTVPLEKIHVIFTVTWLKVHYGNPTLGARVYFTHTQKQLLQLTEISHMSCATHTHNSLVATTEWKIDSHPTFFNYVVHFV